MVHRENRQDAFVGELCSHVPLPAWATCTTVADHIAMVFGRRRPTEILNRIVGRVTIPVRNLVFAFRSRPNEVQRYKAVNVSSEVSAVSSEVHIPVPFRTNSRAEGFSFQLHRVPTTDHCSRNAANCALVRHFVARESVDINECFHDLMVQPSSQQGNLYAVN